MSEGTRRAVAWAAQAWGRTVHDVSRLSGGWTSTMLGLTATDGARAVLRLMTKEPWRRHAPGLLTRESEVQRQLAGTGIPAPTSLAVDPDGTHAGVPAHLMSRLPGCLELARQEDDLLARLAGLLTAIHAHDPGADRPRAYQSWAPAAKRVVPGWARHPELWREAFAELERPAPPYQARFLHRDFHLGNVLWQDGEVSGVVDWVETSWGPAELDVAHASTYLAMLHGPGTAARFAAAYRAQAGMAEAASAQRYWAVMDVVGYLPDPAKVAQPWRDTGRAVADRCARDRLEQHLAAVLAESRVGGPTPANRLRPATEVEHSSG
ncbi:MAG: phosphotransferase family protein [Nocardioidaceae bacterium]